MEGGPKGIAINENSVAICSPEHGVKIYSYSPRTIVRGPSPADLARQLIDYIGADAVSNETGFFSLAKRIVSASFPQTFLSSPTRPKLWD